LRANATVFANSADAEKYATAKKRNSCCLLLAATRENIFLLFIRARILMELFCVVDLSLSLEKTFTTSGFLTYSATMRLLAQLIFSLFSGFSVVHLENQPPFFFPALILPWFLLRFLLRFLRLLVWDLFVLAFYSRPG
jgi:hypothetical protein